MGGAPKRPVGTSGRGYIVSEPFTLLLFAISLLHPFQHLAGPLGNVIQWVLRNDYRNLEAGAKELVKSV